MTNFDAARPPDATTPNHPTPPSGPLTRARARAMQQKVNSLLSTLDLGTYLDGMLFTSDTLCVIRYIPQESHPDENQPRHEDEEKRSQPRREEEEEGLLDERYYRPDDFYFLQCFNLLLALFHLDQQNVYMTYIDLKHLISY